MRWQPECRIVRMPSTKQHQMVRTSIKMDSLRRVTTQQLCMFVDLLESEQIRQIRSLQHERVAVLPRELPVWVRRWYM